MHLRQLRIGDRRRRSSVTRWYAHYVDAPGSGSMVNTQTANDTFNLQARGARMWKR